MTTTTVGPEPSHLNSLSQLSSLPVSLVRPMDTHMQMLFGCAGRRARMNPISSFVDWSVIGNTYLPAYLLTSCIRFPL